MSKDGKTVRHPDRTEDGVSDGTTETVHGSRYSGFSSGSSSSVHSSSGSSVKVVDVVLGVPVVRPRPGVPGGGRGGCGGGGGDGGGGDDGIDTYRHFLCPFYFVYVRRGRKREV